MPSRSLSREQIIAAALTIADADGLDAVSMRTVAARLGVQAMSLYHHVANKAALIDGMHEVLLLSMTIEVDGLGWEDALRSLAHSMRAVALAHPSTFVLLATRPLSTPAELDHVASAVAPLERAGFSTSDQLLALNLFFSALSGLLLAEVAPVPGHADVPEPTAPPESADNPATALIAAAAALAPNPFAAHFDDHVEILLNGLRARFATSTRER